MSTTNPPPPLGVPEVVWSKNRLQQFTQRASMPLPIYQTLYEGSLNAPTFKAQVWVDGICFSSPNSFSNKKMAEQDAAKHAFIGIREKLKNEGSTLILQDTIFCKSIINEYAAKMNLAPTYVTNQSETMLPVFISSLFLNGATYVGDAGKTKREAEQFAARSAILSILGSESSTTMLEIVKSKFKFYDALKQVKGLYSGTGTVPAGVNSLKSIKGSCEIQGGNTTAAVCTLEVPPLIDKRKQVHDGGGTADCPTEIIHDSGGTAKGPSTEILQPSLQMQLPTTPEEIPKSALDTNTLVKGQSLHEIKRPKHLTSSATVTPPIVFVPPASAKKHNRKKKKAKKNLEHESS